MTIYGLQGVIPDRKITYILVVIEFGRSTLPCMYYPVLPKVLYIFCDSMIRTNFELILELFQRVEMILWRKEGLRKEV